LFLAKEAGVSIY